MHISVWLFFPLYFSVSGQNVDEAGSRNGFGYEINGIS